MDEQVLRDAFPNIQNDDAAVVISIPREREGYAARPIKYFQVGRDSLWNGVGQGQPVPSAIPLTPEPPKPPEPPISPVATQKQIGPDKQYVRTAAGLSSLPKSTKTPMLKPGTIVGVDLKSAVELDKHTWVKVLSCIVPEVVGGWTALDLLQNPT